MDADREAERRERATSWLKFHSEWLFRVALAEGVDAFCAGAEWAAKRRDAEVEALLTKLREARAALRDADERMDQQPRWMRWRQWPAVKAAMEEKPAPAFGRVSREELEDRHNRIVPEEGGR